MEKHFCDRCTVLIDDQIKCDARKDGLVEGDFGAELFKVIAMGGEEQELYPASYAADLCPDCQKKLNNLVRLFMTKHES